MTETRELRSRPGGQHLCEGVKRSGRRGGKGKPCGAINTLRTIEGGWRCRHHRDGLTIAGSGEAAQPMPSTKFRTRGDAERFTAWVIQQGATGNMNAAQVRSMMLAVNSFNKLQERAEEQLLKEFKALLARATDQFKRLHEIAAAQEGLD